MDGIVVILIQKFVKYDENNKWAKTDMLKRYYDKII